MNYKVVIITLNFNQKGYTLNCIESLLNSNYNNFKVLLIDNGSTEDNYQELFKLLPKNDNLIFERIDKNIGYVGGVNFGLEIAAKLSPDYFMIINNDILIDNEAINELVHTCIEFNNKAIVTGKVYHFNKPNVIQDIGYSFNNKNELTFNKIGIDEIDLGQFDHISERDLIDDIFWLFPEKLYKDIGGYSTYFWFNAEQADFALRAKNKGYKLIYTPKAKLWHKGSVSIGGRDTNPKLAYWHIQSTLIFRYIHLKKVPFINQYFKIIISITASYFTAIRKKIKGGDLNLHYPNAKLRGLMYFNRWIFIRNDNKGINPFS